MPGVPTVSTTTTAHLPNTVSTSNTTPHQKTMSPGPALGVTPPLSHSRSPCILYHLVGREQVAICWLDTLSWRNDHRTVRRGLGGAPGQQSATNHA